MKTSERWGMLRARPHVSMPPPFCQLTPRRDQIHRHSISRAKATAIDPQREVSPRACERGAMASGW